MIEDIIKVKKDVLRKLLLESQEKKIDKSLYQKASLRAVIEISNFCQLNCKFCGNAKFNLVSRYRLSKKEIIEKVNIAKNFNIDTIHLASGLDYDFPKDILLESIEYIKNNNQNVELAIGKRDLKDFFDFYQAGARKIILKFETSNIELLSKIGKSSIGLKTLPLFFDSLKKIGYKIGTGNMIGIPGQQIDDIINDLYFLNKSNIDSISTSIFTPNKDSEYKLYKKGDKVLGYNFLRLLKDIKKFSNLDFSLNSTLDEYKWIFLKEFGGIISLNLTGNQNYSLYEGRDRKKIDIEEIKKKCNDLEVNLL